jgi:hypothetical protein
MKHAIKFIFVLWLSCGSTAVAFANPTHLPLDANVFQVEPAAEIWLDKDGSMLAERLTSPEMATQFKPMGRTLALGFTPDTV